METSKKEVTAATPNFSGGLAANRPASAPDHSIYHSHDTGDRHRFINGGWQPLAPVHEVEPEVMEPPSAEELAAADEIRAVNAAAAQAAAAPTSGSGDSGQPAPAAAKPKAKK